MLSRAESLHREAAAPPPPPSSSKLHRAKFFHSSNWLFSGQAGVAKGAMPKFLAAAKAGTRLATTPPSDTRVDLDGSSADFRTMREFAILLPAFPFRFQTQRNPFRSRGVQNVSRMRRRRRRSRAAQSPRKSVPCRTRRCKRRGEALSSGAMCDDRAFARVCQAPTPLRAPATNSNRP